MATEYVVCCYRCNIELYDSDRPERALCGNCTDGQNEEKREAAQRRREAEDKLEEIWDRRVERPTKKGRWPY